MVEFDTAMENLKKSMQIQIEVKRDRSQNLIKLEMAKIYFYRENYVESIDLLKDTCAFFNNINDIPYLSESTILLAQNYRLNDDPISSQNIMNQNKIDDNHHNHLVKIEDAIINLIKDASSINDIIKLAADKNSNEDIHAYIYFNIGVITSDKLYLNKAKKIYSDLYSKTNDYRYTHYLNQIKWCKSLPLIPTCIY